MKKISQNNASRKVLSDSQDENFPYEFSGLGVKILVFKNVFSPKHFYGWEIFTKKFPNVKNKTILEIGAGTGITSIYLAKHNAKFVLATDINSYAIKNIKANIILNKLKNIEVQKSDMFKGVKKNKRFDYIYWNMPFMPINSKYKYKSVLERGLFDPGYKITDRFLKESKFYLNENGKILLGTGGSNFGNESKLKELAVKYAYKLKLIARKRSMEINPVKFVLFELSVK